MKSMQERVRDYLGETQQENTAEIENRTATKAFKKAGKVIAALEALEEETGGKFKVLGKAFGSSLDCHWVSIETNIPGKERKHLHVNVFTNGIKFVTTSEEGKGDKLETFGIRNPFAIKKTVKYVAYQAKKHDMI